MTNTIREDVVSISFDVENNPFGDLTAGVDEMKAAVTGGVDDSIESLKRMTKSTGSATDGMDDLTKAAKDLSKTDITDVADDLQDAAKQANKGEKETKKLKDKLKDAANVGFTKTISGLKTVATYAGKAATALAKVAIGASKIALAGVTGAAAAVGGLVAKSVSAYAEYEQLVGGVETLFKSSAPKVQAYANDAYKTAGLSANEYMNTVTSFSASLIQSVGGDTAKATELANMAITDMSDNANKMGTDMDSIIETYQSLAKGNYAMLDNLKLGYGGTKTELERLIADAAKLDKSVDANSLSYGNIVKALHAVQENMGIAGTTAKEAEGTISGSLASMKSAWSNLMPALIQGGDSFDQCVKNLVSSVKIFGKNIKPAIKSALSGVGSLIEELTPIIVAEIPTLVDELLPPLIKAAVGITAGLIKALPSIASALIKELPDIAKELVQAFAEAFDIKMPALDKIEGFFKGVGDMCAKHAGTIKKVIPALLGLVGVFKLFKSFSSLKSLFGKVTGGSSDGKGGIFGGITNTFKSLAAAKPTTILKGIANLAIILGGLTALTGLFMAVAPHIAKLSDFKSIIKVLGAITAVGLVATGLAKLAGIVGIIPIPTVLKGLANMAIVMVGLTALTAVFMAVVPHVAKLADGKAIFKVLGTITAVGLVGAALAALAGIVGVIPIPLVLGGLANIALALGGFTAIVAAFGALSKIPHFNEFIESGGDTLANLVKQIGKIGGALVGGLGEGISESLPKIGKNISDFATSLKPFFTAFQGVDMNGVSAFFGTIGDFMLKMAGNELASLFTGGTDLTSFGTELTNFATNSQGFFTTVAALPTNSFTNAKLLFQSLADMGNVPKTGGIKQWFSGETDFTSLADGLSQLGSQKVISFYNAIAALPQTGFSNAKLLFQSIADIGNVPQTGGIKQWFTGETEFTALATGLAQLASQSVVGFFTTVATLPAAGFSNAKLLFKSLADIGNIPNTGGVAQWFSGENDFAGLAEKLPPFGKAMASFYSSIAGIEDFSRISQLFKALKGIGDAVPNKGGIAQWFSGENDFASLGADLKQFGIDIKDFLTQVNGFDAGKLNSLWDALNNVGTVTTDLTSVVDANMGKMLTSITSRCPQMVKAIKQTTNSIKTAVKGSDLASSGAYMMSGLIRGINSKRGAVMATARSIAKSAASTINAELKIKSPSRVTTQSGEDTGQGLANGLQKMKGKVTEAAHGLSTAVDTTVKPTVNNYTPSSSSVSTTNTSNQNNYFSPQFTLNMNGASATESNKYKVKKWIKESIEETFESMGRVNPELCEV